MHANTTIMFKDCSIDVHFNCNDDFLHFELSQSSSKSWHVRQTCQLALTLVTTEIMI